MTTTIIRTSNTSVTGYELVVREGDRAKVLPIDKQPPNEPFTLILPENPSNRKFFSAKKVDAAGGELELTYKQTRSISSGERTPRKGLEEYLDGDDRETYLALVEKAKANREAAQKAAKPAKKSKADLMAELEALQAQLAALKGGEEA